MAFDFGVALVDGVLGLLKRRAQPFERADVLVELRQGRGDRRRERLAQRQFLRALNMQVLDALVELPRRVFETGHFAQQRCAPFDQTCVSRARVRNTLVRSFGRLAGFRQPPLCGTQTGVRFSLVFLETPERLARLGLPLVNGGSLLLGPAAIEREHLGRARNARVLFGRACELRIVTDDGLLVPVEVECGRLDGALQFVNGVLDARDARSQGVRGLAIGGHAIARVANLALRRENAAGFRRLTAIDEMSPADDISLQGRDRRTRLARGRHGFVEGSRNPGLTETRRRSPTHGDP